MSRSYGSLLRVQGGWSSLHGRLHAAPDTLRQTRPDLVTLQTGMLGTFKAPLLCESAPKNFQAAPNCGSWASTCCLHPTIEWYLSTKNHGRSGEGAGL